jgi:hypothetical protein
MNTSFVANQHPSLLSFDIADSYPTGLLAQLGPYYNDSQELIDAQIRFIANQADITSQKNSAYAIQNIELEKTGTLAPTSAIAQSAASNYINQANYVNYINQQIATNVNMQYTNAYAIEKSCRDAAYSAFLTTEASQVRLDRINTNAVVLQLANSPININPLNMIFPSTISTIVSNFKQESQNDINDASGNVQAFITNTQYLLNNTAIKSSSVTTNLYLVAAFNTFVKSIAQAIVVPLLEISGKQSLVTQNIPSISLTSGISVANFGLAFLNSLISNINGNTVDLSGNILAISNLATTLDNIAKNNDLNMYIRDAVQNNLINTISTMVRNKSPVISFSNGPISPYAIATQGIEAAAKAAAASARAAGSLIVSAAIDLNGVSAAAERAVVAAANAAASISPIEAKTIALNANKSAETARSVSNAVINLNTAYNNTNILDPVIKTTALESLNTIRYILTTVAKLTNNTSANATPNLSRTASNIILGILNKITETEKLSLEAAEEANSVLVLINKAYAINAIITDTLSIQNKLWAVNSATARAKEISEKIKDKVFLLNKTTHTSITSSKIAVQTAEANTLGTNLANSISRTNMVSRNIHPLPPPAYNGFKAAIRANTFVPIKPSPEYHVFRDKIPILNLNSLKTISATNIKVAQDVQQIKDMSIYSFRQQ